MFENNIPANCRDRGPISPHFSAGNTPRAAKCSIMDLSKLQRARWFDIELPSLGELQTRNLTVKVLADLEKDAEDSNVTNPDFVRRVISAMAHFKASEIKDTKVEEITQVTIEQASQIPDAELEMFSERFCEHHKNLFGFKKTEETPTDESESSETKYEPEHPKQPEESYVDYLRRGFKTYLKREKALFASAFSRIPNYVDVIKRLGSIDIPYKSIGNIAAQMKDFAAYRNLAKASEQFRDHLRPLDKASEAARRMLEPGSIPDVLRKNAELSDRLENQISAVRNQVNPTPVFPEPRSLPEFRHPMAGTNERLDAMMDRADEVLPLITNSAELIRSLNETALTILGKFAEEAENSKKFARIAVFIAVLSLVASAVGTWLTWYQGQEQSKETKEQTEVYNRQINSLIQSQDQRTREILKSLNENNAANSEAIASAINKALKDALSEIERRTAPKQ